MYKRRYKADRKNWRKTRDKLRDQYNAYRRAYEAQENKLNSRGLEMYKEKFDFKQWKEQWLRKKQTLEAEVNMGLRRGIGNVNQYLVRDQAYELSYKAGKAVYKALEKQGELLEGVSKNEYMMLIRQGRYLEASGWWSDISNYYHTMKDEYIKQGYKPKDATIKVKEEIKEIWYKS